jgi:hypothetical protein
MQRLLRPVTPDVGNLSKTQESEGAENPPASAILSDLIFDRSGFIGNDGYPATSIS